MTTDSLELASLLCSRLCHDMLSPVGALSNGLELLAEEKDPDMRQRIERPLPEDRSAPGTDGTETDDSVADPSETPVPPPPQPPVMGRPTPAGARR